MIAVTINGADQRKFTVRYQHKIEKDGEIVWADAELITCTGQSQPCGIDKRAQRLIVEDTDGVPLNANA